jgi:DNA-binding PadR family transcriptional regulator
VTKASQARGTVGSGHAEQSVLSPVRLAVLGLLIERPSHRYEVAQRFTRRVGATWQIRAPQIYQGFQRLHRDGHIELSTPEATTRSQSVFRATREGRRVFEEWIASDVADDPAPMRNGLVIRLSFLRPEHLVTLLHVVDQREYALLSRIREYSDTCPELDDARTVDWTGVGAQLILEGTIATFQGELRWLRRVRVTLEELQRGSSP